MATIKSSSFWWGVATALGSAYIYQKIVIPADKKKRGQHPQRRQRDRGGSSNEQQLLMDRPDLELRLIRKAEAVIRGRTSALSIVVERCTNDHNYSAILRTAEALGIQHCYIIDPPKINTIEDTVENMKGFKVQLTAQESQEHRQHRLFAQNATEWLTVTEFDSVQACVAHVRQELGYALWVTDLSQEAVPLTREYFPNDDDSSAFPPKVAIVMGTEAVGCSQEMLDAADCRIYLPLTGFADSLNLSVATALVVQQVFHLCPNYVANMSEPERQELRQLWFPKLARQRLLSAREKKERKRLLQNIQACEKAAAQSASSHPLTPSQEAKLAQLPVYRAQLAAIETKWTAAEAAVQELVECPPAPLADARRCDEHRVTFVGKGVRQLHAAHWQNLAATATNRQSVPLATAAYFRRNVAADSNNETTAAAENNEDDDAKSS